MRKLFVAGILSGFAAALTFSGPAKAGPKNDMMAADRAFSIMSVEKGAHAAFLAYMDDDVRLYEGPKRPIVGKAAAAAYYEKTTEGPDNQLQWVPVDAEASPDGALGFTRGTWLYTAKTKDGTTKATGYYVTVWKRQADGHYKFTLDMGGSDPKPGKPD